MPMQPRPMADTSSPCVPSRRRSMPSNLAKHARVAERVAARLGIDAQTMRPESHVDALDELPVARADRVDLARVAARQPQNLAVRRDAAHVGRGAARDAPLAHLLALLERDQ